MALESSAGHRARGDRHGVLALALRVAASTPYTIYEGSLVGHRNGSKLAEMVDPDNPRSDLIIRGCARNEVTVTTAGDSDGATDADDRLLQVQIECGLLEGFANSEGDDEITEDDIGKIVYAYDDDTLSKTSQDGTLSPAGVLWQVCADGTLSLIVDDEPAAYLFGSEGWPTVSPANGANLTDAAQNVAIADGATRELPAGTLTAARTKTTVTTNAVEGNELRYVVGTQAFALTITNGGGGGGSQVIPPGSGQLDILYRFDGTNWKVKEVSAFDGWFTGTALTDTATTTVQRSGRKTRFVLAGTMSQGETITLGTTGAVVGDIIKIVRTSTSAQTAAIVNGGAGAGTLCTLVASKVNFAQAIFDGTNWLFDGCGPT